MSFIKKLFSNFNAHNLLRMAAALSFYTALSLPPLLLITLTVLALFGESAQDSLVMQVQDVIGEQAAEAVRLVIQGAKDRPDLSKFGGIAGFVTLLFSSSAVFAELQSSMNVIMESEDAPGKGVWGWLRRRLLSMGMVLALGFLSAVSLAVTAALSLLSPDGGAALEILNQAVSLAVFTGLFAAMYRIMPDAHLPWRKAAIGGVITAALFTVGKHLIGLYLGKSSVGSSYGAAGSLIAFLAWVYYSAVIVFIGAEITALVSRGVRGARHGTGIATA